MKTKIKNNLGLIIGSIVLILAVIFTAGPIASTNSKIQKKNDELARLQGVQTSDNKTSDSLKAKMKEVTGFDAQKKKNDDVEAVTFCEDAFSWKDNDDYVKVRKALIEKYKLKEDSEFLTKFMPDVESEDEGVKGNTLDANGLLLNLSYESMNSTCVGMKDDTYSYVTTVNVTTNNSYENSKGETVPVTGAAQFILTYDCDKDNNITNINGYIIRN